MIPGDIQFKETNDIPPETLQQIFVKEQWNDFFDLEEVALHLRTALYVVSAWRGDELVGYGRLDGDGRIWVEISDLLVKSEHQGQGIGTEIVRRLVDRIKALEPYHIHVEPLSDREVHIYGKFGFAEYQTRWMSMKSDRLARRCVEVRGHEDE